MASSARRPPAGARADGGPARRRCRAHLVCGHLLNRPRAATQPGDLARPIVRRASASRRAGLGRSGARLAIRDGRRAARDRAQALLRTCARAAHPLPVRSRVRPPRPARRALGIPRPRRSAADAPADPSPAPAARNRRSGRPRLPRPRRSHPSLHALRRQCRVTSAGRHPPVVLRLDGRARSPRPARRGRRGRVARRSSRRARRVVRRRLLRLARHHRRADRRRLRDTALTQPWAVRLDGRSDVLVARVSTADRARRDREPRRRPPRGRRQGAPPPPLSRGAAAGAASLPSGASSGRPRATASTSARPRRGLLASRSARGRLPS